LQKIIAPWSFHQKMEDTAYPAATLPLPYGRTGVRRENRMKALRIGKKGPIGHRSRLSALADDGRLADRIGLARFLR